MLNMTVLSMIVVVCLLMFIIQRNHLLVSLIALESIILILVFGIIINRGVGLEVIIMHILLCFAACEASLGLACLISIVRFLGSDSFFLFNSIK